MELDPIRNRLPFTHLVLADLISTNLFINCQEYSEACGDVLFRTVDFF